MSVCVNYYIDYCSVFTIYILTRICNWSYSCHKHLASSNCSQND